MRSLQCHQGSFAHVHRLPEEESIKDKGIAYFRTGFKPTRDTIDTDENVEVKGQVEQDTSTDVSTNTNGRQDEDQENPKVWVVKSFHGFHILAWLKKVWRVSNLGVERSLPMLLVYSRNSAVNWAQTEKKNVTYSTK